MFFIYIRDNITHKSRNLFMFYGYCPREVWNHPASLVEFDFSAITGAKEIRDAVGRGVAFVVSNLREDVKKIVF